jgi:hypothetical protein
MGWKNIWRTREFNVLLFQKDHDGIQLSACLEKAQNPFQSRTMAGL